MQTVSVSYFGIDPRTGVSVSGNTAGPVRGIPPRVVQMRLKGQRAQKGAGQDGEVLIPVWDEHGDIAGYERSLAPEMLKVLDRNAQLDEMVGAWAGRQAEEATAQGINRSLVDRLHEHWKQGRGEGREAEYVDLADPELEDPVMREAWALLPVEAKDYIRQTFGEDGFRVRRDLVNNAVGYRQASVQDFWTGKSRVDEKYRDAFRTAATAVLGRKAVPFLARAEKGWQSAVSAAKNTIVIRSIIVPAFTLPSLRARCSPWSAIDRAGLGRPGSWPRWSSL